MESSENSGKKRILVIESGIPVIPFEQSLLLRQDHDLVRADTVEEAIQKVNENVPHLVILDERIGDFDGADVVSMIREQEGGKNCAVVLISSDMPQEKPVGVNTILQKPVSGLDFSEACRRLLAISVRKSVRLLVYVQVQGYVKSNLFLCNSLNLSASGVLILTARRLKLGDKIKLQITLPLEKNKVQVEGEVVREAREIKSRLNGYGVVFMDLSEEDKGRLQKFVDAGLAKNSS